jgi:hypothetical protein
MFSASLLTKTPSRKLFPQRKQPAQKVAQPPPPKRAKSSKDSQLDSKQSDAGSGPNAGKRAPVLTAKPTASHKRKEQVRRYNKTAEFFSDL